VLSIFEDAYMSTFENSQDSRASCPKMLQNYSSPRATRALERATSRGAPSRRDPAARRAQGRGVAAPDGESEGKRANRAPVEARRGRAIRPRQLWLIYGITKGRGGNEKGRGETESERRALNTSEWCSFPTCIAAMPVSDPFSATRVCHLAGGKR
jgi:hypothetical protein